jgi:hypothetical protein
MSTTAATTNRQYRLARRPSGLPVREDWSFTTEPVGEPTEAACSSRRSRSRSTRRCAAG